MKKKPVIWVNCLVKNEERWIWYGLNSVLPFVDKVIVWDTGSKDLTQKIIKTVKSNKANFLSVGEVGKKDFGKLRQKMLEQTSSDWVWILDGDEVWPRESVIKLISAVEKAPLSIQSFCVRPINFVGDIRFIHPETFSGKTPHGPEGLKGFFSTRIFRRNIPGLHVKNEYGKEAFFDKNEVTLRKRKGHVQYLPDVYYWHLSYLLRSSSRIKDRQVMMRQKKRKYEIGLKRPYWMKIPEVFFSSRPKIVPDPFYKMSLGEYFKAFIQTPLKKIKRKLLN